MTEKSEIAPAQKRRLAEIIAEKDKARGRPLTDRERLANLLRFLDEPDEEPGSAPALPTGDPR